MKPENPYDNSIDRSVGVERHEIWQEGFDAAIKWLHETCPHGVGDFHDNDEPVTMCFRYACSSCMEELV